MLFEYPTKAAFNRIVPKAKFYERSKPSKTVREKFVSQVGQVVWSFKLAPETINLAATDQRLLATAFEAFKTLPTTLRQ